MNKFLRKIFGEISKNFVEIKDYKNGQLWIELRNSTWRSEFKLHEKRIIEEIKQKFKRKFNKKNKHKLMKTNRVIDFLEKNQF